MPLFQGRGFSNSSHPGIRLMQCEEREGAGAQCGGSPPCGGLRRNKTEKREIRPRKFNDGSLCGVTRPPRGANPTVRACTSAARRGQRVREATLPSLFPDDECPRYVENKTRKLVFRRNTIPPTVIGDV